MICNNTPRPKAKARGKVDEWTQISAYPSARALSQASMARFTGRPQ